MNPVDDIGVAIATVYAKALFNLATTENVAEDTFSELRDLVDYVNHTPAFEHYLIAGSVDVDRRRSTLESALRGKASDLLTDFVQVLNRKGRLALLEEIREQYRLLREAAQNRVEATVKTATPLSDDARESLLAALKSYTGSEPVLTESVDSEMIGGMVLHIGDKKIDFSVASRLKKYQEAMLTRATRELQGGRRFFQEG